MMLMEAEGQGGGDGNILGSGMGSVGLVGGHDKLPLLFHGL